jgi:hypothetical protein
MSKRSCSTMPSVLHANFYLQVHAVIKIPPKDLDHLRLLLFVVQVAKQDYHHSIKPLPPGTRLPLSESELPTQKLTSPLLTLRPYDPSLLRTGTRRSTRTQKVMTAMMTKMTRLRMPTPTIPLPPLHDHPKLPLRRQGKVFLLRATTIMSTSNLQPLIRPLPLQDHLSLPLMR